ncbi:hypothetical protein EVAR_67639_1 [Eumeta japonica]|uniref:Uncharacterized protein n=1 Tax=Eumeta variegata TaxID=151549 RepID=A0A4C1Z8M0_EUMVA|nr:hypothetical protein EVAR_67639_1 [Eumeta japonica]
MLSFTIAVTAGRNLQCVSQKPPLSSRLEILPDGRKVVVFEEYFEDYRFKHVQTRKYTLIKKTHQSLEYAALRYTQGSTLCLFYTLRTLMIYHDRRQASNSHYPRTMSQSTCAVKQFIAYILTSRGPLSWLGRSIWARLNGMLGTKGKFSLRDKHTICIMCMRKGKSSAVGIPACHPAASGVADVAVAMFQLTALSALAPIRNVPGSTLTTDKFTDEFLIQVKLNHKRNAILNRRLQTLSSCRQQILSAAPRAPGQRGRLSVLLDNLSSVTPLLLHASAFNKIPIPNRETGNALVILLGKRVSVGGGATSLSSDSRARLSSKML